MREHDPKTELDEAIGRATRGESDGGDVLGLFARAVVIVPSRAAVGENFEGFSPVLYDRDGTAMLAVFTSLARAAIAGGARYAITIGTRDLLRMMPEGHGIVVNPGHREGFELPPDGVARLRRDLSEDAQ